ncbi:hypothetical protein [Histidinibacterium aquaticum]|uniref:DoxX family protein n=1 Tax=Histidinibacterium aquaticum TaxID=2613962 RepID=A0A5J5GLB3_9RHOB|nr:hypothetical protein [Histidinibacterium aquaticum]KAA9009051.1 hypothetical protein F3S47_07270 [Histidinibacterium aquaticum]
MTNVKRASDDAIKTTGLNLIRILLASYLIASALGLAQGPHGGPLAAPFLGEELGRSVGGGVYFLLAFFLLCGIKLRVMALSLAAMTLASGFVMIFAHNALLEVFWRDLAIVAALMLTYLAPDRRALKHSAIFRRSPKVRRVEMSDRIVPRRVTVKDGLAARSEPRRARLVSAATADAPLGKGDLARLRLNFLDVEDELEVTNIFADLDKRAVA